MTLRSSYWRMVPCTQNINLWDAYIWKWSEKLSNNRARCNCITTFVLQIQNFVKFCKAKCFLPKHSVNMSRLIILCGYEVSWSTDNKHKVIINSLWSTTWKHYKRTLWTEIFIQLLLLINLTHLGYTPCWKFKKVYSQSPKTFNLTFQDFTKFQWNT